MSSGTSRLTLNAIIIGYHGRLKMIDMQRGGSTPTGVMLAKTASGTGARKGEWVNPAS